METAIGFFVRNEIFRSFRQVSMIKSQRPPALCRAAVDVRTWDAATSGPGRLLTMIASRFNAGTLSGHNFNKTMISYSGTYRVEGLAHVALSFL